MSGLRGHAGTDGGDPGRCAECNAAEPVGPCAACESMICGDCGVFSRDPGGRRVICISCASLIADVSAHRDRRLRDRRGEPTGAMVLFAVAVVIAFAAVALSLLATCASPSRGPADNGHDRGARGDDDQRGVGGDTAAGRPETRPSATRPPDPPPPAGPLGFRAAEPPGGTGGLPTGTPGAVVAARVFALSDSQLHHLYGKRTFAQSPFADRAAFEVAVRPAALDDGSDLLLAAFLAEYRARYANHSLVFLGDAADLSCTHELDAFAAVIRRAGVGELLAVTSNHDGFFVGNFTSRADLGGRLAATDMPHDWTRACSLPGQRDDYRLTRGRAVARLAAMLPAAPANPEASAVGAIAGDWATSVRHEGADPASAYRGAYLYYVRPLGGGDAAADDDAPAVWGVFLDTVDYRGFDLEASRGAGSVGSVSREQLRFLDRAMFEARAVTGTRPIAFVAFGHHPLRAFHRDARRRTLHFLDVHPRIVGYVAAHTHRAEERTVALPGGRTIPELVVGSTTDAPQSARILWVEAAPAPRTTRTKRSRRRGARKSYRFALASRRLRLDASALCDGIAELPRDTAGYTGYRLLRDDTPDLNLGLLEKLEFGLRLSDLGHKRLVQGLGALAVENELVRSLALVYARAPVELAPADRQALADIARRRFAAGDALADVRPYLQGEAEDARTEYNNWHDPVTRPVLAVAELGVHRFGPHAALFARAREARTRSPVAERYFLCHAVHAAAAEARRPRREGGVNVIE